VVKKGQSYICTPPMAVRPVQSLSACTRVHFTVLYLLHNLMSFIHSFISIQPLVRF